MVHFGMFLLLLVLEEGDKSGRGSSTRALKGSGLFCPAVANASGLPRCGARSDVQISFPPGQGA